MTVPKLDRALREQAGIVVEPSEEEALYDDAIRLCSDIINNRTGQVRWWDPEAEEERIMPASLPGEAVPAHWLELGPVEYPMAIRAKMVSRLLGWQGTISEGKSALELRENVKELFSVVRGGKEIEDDDEAIDTP